MKFLMLLIFIISCGGKEDRRDEMFRAPVSSPEALTFQKNDRADLVCKLSDASLKCELP